MIKINKKIILGLFVIFFILGCSSTMKLSKLSKDDYKITIPDKFHYTNQTNKNFNNKFWLSFKDKELNRIIKIALKKNYNLKSILNKLEQSDFVYKKSKSNNKIKLDLTGGYNKTFTNSKNTSNSYDLGLVSSYEFDLWGNIDSKIKASLNNKEIQKNNYFTAEISLASQICIKWFSLILNKKQENYLNLQIKKINEIINLLYKYKNKNGEFSYKDILEQKQILNDRKKDLLENQKQKEILLNQLTVLIGGKTSDNINITAEFPKINKFPKTGVPSEIIMNRPDVKTVFLQIISANELLKTAITNQWPKISLSASMFSYQNNTSNIFNNWLTNLAANISMPLINGNSLKNEVKRNKAVLKEKINLYKNKVLNALTEINNALFSEYYNDKQLKLLFNKIENMNNINKLNLFEFKTGKSNLLSLLNNDLRKINYETAYTKMYYNKLISRLDFYRFIAGSWEENK